jgi:hypothetical protein
MLIHSLGSSVVKQETVDRQNFSKPADFTTLLHGRLAQTTSITKPESIQQSPANDEPVALGTISGDNPTVSNLLVKHPRYGKKCWKIIHSAINQQKPFTRIQAGTTVYLNPQTLEITWDKKKPQPFQIAAEAAYQGNNPPERMPAFNSNRGSFQEKIIQALQPFKGSSYAEMNCYELVVNGLKKCGVQYHGRGGLKDKLIQMAVGRGRAQNSYLTGEGLVKAAGAKLYSRTLVDIQNARKTAETLYEEIQPHLEQGAVLSFSTPSKGHTGIISRQKSLWTYINSGRMDHRIEAGNTVKGVGEEGLKEELDNWCRLAARRQESLQITLGRLLEQKLTQYSKAPKTNTS